MNIIDQNAYFWHCFCFGICEHQNPSAISGVQLLKQGLHLEIFDPSRRMIEPGKAGSRLVAVVGDGGGDDDDMLFDIGQNQVAI